MGVHWKCFAIVILIGTHYMGFDEEIMKIVPKFALDHYENTHMQYTEIFHGCKNDNFQTKIITRQKIILLLKT